MICKKCVLPQYGNDIRINADGVCNICQDYENDKPAKTLNPLLEFDLIKVLDKYRQKNKYDCLIMVSGGKDSVLSLYYMKKKYKMNPLALTFDHGFENDQALGNIKNAVDILGVDWAYYKTDFMKDVFRRVITSGSKAPICHVCAIWYTRFVQEQARRYRIPLIVAGWTKGQAKGERDKGDEYRAMSIATSDFIKENLRRDARYKDFPLSMEEALSKARRKFKTRIISPHWYLKWDPAEIKEILEKELKWRAPDQSYPLSSTNCLINFANVYLSMKNYGYTHYHIEMSKLIRVGELSREEALEALKINFDLGFVNSVIGKIGCELKA